ncbi:hypothetical protein M421DRAFT_72161, partial [Didymella exigua CBS 183.55]
GQETTRLPVRSALFKQRTGGLVVRWVTTSEYPLLYVFIFAYFCTPRESLGWTSCLMVRKMVRNLAGSRPMCFPAYSFA